MSQIWNIWDQIYQISCKTNFIAKKLTKPQITFWKNKFKKAESKFKKTENKREQELSRKRAMALKNSLTENSKNKFLYQSDLKERGKTNDSSHLFAKARSRTRYFSKQKKMPNSFASNFSLIIIRTDELWICLLHFQCKEYMTKKDSL